jgi:hypothetical protein
VLRIILEFHNVVRIVIAAHQMRLRAAAHAANVFHCVQHIPACYRQLTEPASEECGERMCAEAARPYWAGIKTTVEPAPF